jgi:hypothetical protein
MSRLMRGMGKKAPVKDAPTEPLDLGDSGCLIEGANARWTYAGSDAQWRTFMDEEVRMLEAAYKKGMPSVDLRLSESVWTINFKNMSMSSGASGAYSSLNQTTFPIARRA